MLQFILFADDTNLFISNLNIDVLMEIVNIELIKLTEWFRANKLSLKAQKTNYIFFGHKKRGNKKNIIIDGKPITQVEFVKFLECL